MRQINATEPEIEPERKEPPKPSADIYNFAIPGPAEEPRRKPYKQMENAKRSEKTKQRMRRFDPDAVIARKRIRPRPSAGPNEITISEIASRMNLTPKTIRDSLSDHGLKPREGTGKAGTPGFYSRSEVTQWMQERRRTLVERLRKRSHTEEIESEATALAADRSKFQEDLLAVMRGDLEALEAEEQSIEIELRALDQRRLDVQLRAQSQRAAIEAVEHALRGKE